MRSSRFAVACAKQALKIAARTYRMWTSPRRAVATRVVSDAKMEGLVRQLVWKPDAWWRQRMQPAGLYGRRREQLDTLGGGRRAAGPRKLLLEVRRADLFGTLFGKRGSDDRVAVGRASDSGPSDRLAAMALPWRGVVSCWVRRGR